MNTTHIPLSFLHESHPPLLIKFTTWVRENKQAISDLIILVCISAFTFYWISMYDLTESFYQFTRQHENLEVDDLVLTLGTAFPIFLTIFALRRWAEAGRRLRQANTDSLTGQFNRRKGWEVAQFEATRAKRYRRPLSVILFDIDHFKAINDTYGHLTGDRVLRSIANIVHDQLRITDTLVRWGGEEFLIISPETTQDEARPQAERLRQKLADPSIQGTIHPTVSFGVAQLQADEDFNALFQRADEKLYAAKSGGRNKVM